MHPSLSSLDQRQPLDQSTMPKPQEDAEFWPLSTKPYFCLVLAKSHLATRFQLFIPRILSELLPIVTVPAKIVYRGKVWNLIYRGDQGKKKFENQTWRKFAEDNNLAVGDACVFELIEGGFNTSIVKFKVQILRDDFPSELVEKADGCNMNNPIDID